MNDKEKISAISTLLLGRGVSKSAIEQAARRANGNYEMFLQRVRVAVPDKVWPEVTDYKFSEPAPKPKRSSGPAGTVWGRPTFGGTASPAPAAAPQIDPFALQRGLAALGYDVGPIDGIIGPRTRAAIQKWQADGSPPFPSGGAPAAQPAPSTLMSDLGGGGGVAPTGAAPGGAAIPESPTKNMSDAEIDQYIRDNYGGFAWALDIPEISVILRQAVREDWPQGKMEGRIQQTDWWRTTAPTVRAFLSESNRDPKAMEVRIGNAVDGIYRYMNQLGLDWVTPERAWALAVDSIKFGWTAEKTQQTLHAEFQWHANVGTTPDRGDMMADKLRLTADQYLVPLSEPTLQQWVNQILSGQVDENGFELYMRTQAKGLFPTLSAALDRGITVRQYIEPYAQVTARELEMNPTDIDWTDRKWIKAFTQIDPKSGERTAMSLADWIAEVRSNPEYGWQNTTGAKETTMELAQKIGERWGVTA